MKPGSLIIFGTKETFSIEIKLCEISNKYNLRFSICNNTFGDFKKCGSLDYLINDYFKLLNLIKADDFDPCFSFLSDYEIFAALFLYSDENLSTAEEEFKYNRMEHSGFTFAENQLNNFTFGIIFTNGIIKLLIYEMSGTKEPQFYSFVLNVTIFLNSYKAFMNFAFKNNLKKSGPFFNDIYSVSDIE